MLLAIDSGYMLGIHTTTSEVYDKSTTVDLL